jgi:hypothetical protein
LRAAPPPPPLRAAPPPPPPPAVPPTTAFEPPLTTMLPTPGLPPGPPPGPPPTPASRAPVPPDPLDDGHDRWWQPDEEPVTPLNPFTAPQWQVSESADLGSVQPRPGGWRAEPLPDLPADEGVGPETARETAPEPPQEPAWLSMQPPDFADDVRPGRHRAPERESGRHRRP